MLSRFIPFPLQNSSNPIQSQVEDLSDATTDATSIVMDYGARAIGPAVSIIVIIVLAFIVLRLLKTVVHHVVARVMERHDEPPRELEMKANTLASVIESAGRMVVGLVATMMILTNLGLEIAPLLASAGVVGLAIGFGAQSLIRDFLTGFFILLEDQFAVGDVVTINEQTGFVEHLNLRRTGLRALDGSMIFIPNGEILMVINLTKQWARAIIDVDISYDDDIDNAIRVLEELLDGIEVDPEIGSVITSPAEVLGVTTLGEYQVTIRAWMKTKPMEQWRVQRVMLKRVKQAFDANGITIPYPHSVMHMQANGQAHTHPEMLLREQQREEVALAMKPEDDKEESADV